jgi:hypothetical protein
MLPAAFEKQPDKQRLASGYSLKELVKFIFLMLLFTFPSLVSNSQTIVFTGNIKDDVTHKPVSDVNIKVSGNNHGTTTDQTGNFSIKLEKVPVTLIFTCVGYEISSYNVTANPGKTVEFLLVPKSYTLQEVDISSKKYAYLFKDRDYAVLDYEILGDNLVLLIFRNQLKESELVVLARNGDTLAFSPLPDYPPSRLYKDFLANVHYISKADKSNQFLYNEKFSRVEFYRAKSVDSLMASVGPFIFKMNDHLYFQERLASGFGTAFGYYINGAGKRYIRQVINMKKIKEQGDDQTFYQSWNGSMPADQYFSRPSEYFESPEFDFTTGFLSGRHFEENEARAQRIEFYKMIYPVIKLGEDRIAFFNFVSDTLELMNRFG